MIRYEDFSIKIEPQRGDVYPVIVLRSPAGEGRSQFRLPFDPDEIGAMLIELGGTVRGSSPERIGVAPSPGTQTPPRQIGDQLYDALFSGAVRGLFRESLGIIRERERHGDSQVEFGLRIKLHIDPEDPSLAKLAGLPWELLYRRETRDFLNLSHDTPVVRYLDVQRSYVPLQLRLPLRILVVMSSPVDLPPLDLAREREQIEASWARCPDVEVEFLEAAGRPTIMALQERLAEAQRPYHVLHYMGHGAFDEHSGQGALVMEDGSGRGHMVQGSTLGVLLRDASALRLVFLNACETARVSRQMGFDPFGGVAAAMVLAGVPAVVAMQFPITDRAAITFAQRFYPLLARGHPVDYAVAEARRAVRFVESEAMEWATPVLFMRAPDGVIFESGETGEPPETPPPLPPVAGEGLRFKDTGEIVSDIQLKLQVYGLYEEAKRLAQAQQWSQVQTKMGEIRALEAEFSDKEGLEAQAQRALWEEQERKRQRRQELESLYARAVRLMETGRYQEALDQWAQVQQRDAEFPDWHKVEESATMWLEALRRPPELEWEARPAEVAPRPEPRPARLEPTARRPTRTKPKQPRWMILAIVGLIVAICVVLVILVVVLSQKPSTGPVQVNATAGSAPTSPIQPISLLPASARTGRIAFVSDRDGNEEIYVADLETGNVQRLTNHSADDHQPDWSPNGKQIVFTSNRQHSGDRYDVWTMNDDGTNLTAVVTMPAWNEYARWSPEGTEISFSSTADYEGVANAEIFVAPLGGEPSRFTSSSAESRLADWSPAGTQLVFTEGFQGHPDWDLFTLEVVSGEAVAWLDDGTCDVQPAWSPGGEWIAFLRTQDTDGDGQIEWQDSGNVWVGAAGGGGLRQVTSDVWASSPAWSPDGKWLAFTLTNDANGNGRLDSADTSDIWAVSLDGGELGVLVEDGYAPSWTK